MQSTENQQPSVQFFTANKKSAFNMYSYGSRRLEQQTSKISAKAWQPAILVNVTPVTIDLANISRNW